MILHGCQSLFPDVLWVALLRWEALGKVKLALLRWEALGTILRHRAKCNCQLARHLLVVTLDVVVIRLNLRALILGVFLKLLQRGNTLFGHVLELVGVLQEGECIAAGRNSRVAAQSISAGHKDSCAKDGASGPGESGFANNGWRHRCGHRLVAALHSENFVRDRHSCRTTQTFLSGAGWFQSRTRARNTA